MMFHEKMDTVTAANDFDQLNGMVGLDPTGWYLQFDEWSERLSANPDLEVWIAAVTAGEQIISDDI